MTFGDFDLPASLERIRHWLPTQGPIKDFIHHNTLHAFQHLPFYEGVELAAATFGARDYLSLAEYESMWSAGKISDAGISLALAATALPEERRAELRAAMFREAAGGAEPPLPAPDSLRKRWREERGLDLDAKTHPTLFRLLAGYLDQGVGLWRVPHVNHSFYGALARWVEESALPIGTLSRAVCRRLLKLPPADAVKDCLSRMVGDESGWEAYLLDMFLAHPGWSGMVNVLEGSPHSLLERRQISLLEAAAIELILERGQLERDLGADFPPLLAPGTAWKGLRGSESHRNPDRSLHRLWQAALEWTVHGDILAGVAHVARNPAPAPAPKAQALFCIDDRECSLRRHLEELEPRISTFAYAGFFGLDFVFQSVNGGVPIKQCPAPATPRHLIREDAQRNKRPRLRRGIPRHLHSAAHSKTLFRGWMLTPVLGLWSSVRLAQSVLHPTSSWFAQNKVNAAESTVIHYLRNGDEKSIDGYHLGYSYPEMADRVGATLRNIGLTRGFAPLVFIVAHQASSTNNPHFAAYDCGACSGRSGAPNARAFALMANDPELRKILLARGFDIPAETHFVGAIHDTTRDEIAYFDLEALPATHLDAFQEFRIAMGTALGRNASERVRRFELAPRGMDPKSAREHVRLRSEAIFEPRPELNHATNAACIVGRRSLTRSLFLDRRSFLNSYDPTIDPDGDILAGLLGALVPVCGGINLEYFFSRVDNSVYGAGTKLPHNVVGLLGVANGVEGDLRTGLPSQMIELHDPVRLLMLVEQSPEVALRAATKNPAVYEWLKNDWIRFACISPEDASTHILRGSRFERFETGTIPPRAQTSAALLAGQREPLPVHVLSFEVPS